MKLEQLERLRSEIPPAAPCLPILVIHIRPQVKTRQSQSYKFKKIAKNSNFEILQETLHALTHLLKLFDKMYKYEMDPTRTVGATERTRDAGRMQDGRRRDERTDGVKPIYPPTTLLCGGIMRKTSQSMPVTPNGLHSNQKYTHTGNPYKAALPFQTHECVVESVRKYMAEWINEWRMSEGVIGCVIEWVDKGMIERAEE